MEYLLECSHCEDRLDYEDNKYLYDCPECGGDLEKIGIKNKGIKDEKVDFVEENSLGDFPEYNSNRSGYVSVNYEFLTDNPLTILDVENSYLFDVDGNKLGRVVNTKVKGGQVIVDIEVNDV